MADLDCDVLVLGGGPGGYSCAIRAGQRGLDAIVVEPAALGGTCLNVGCLPSKALIHAAEAFAALAAGAGENPYGITVGPPAIDLARMVAWKDGIVRKLTGGVGGLLSRAKVKVIEGRAEFLDGKTLRVEGETGTQTVRARRVVIATGARPVELPDLPFGGSVLSSSEALALTELPESLAVIGGGYIGLEIGTAYAKLGSRVTVVEAGERILPRYDAELTRPVARRLEALGIEVLTGTTALGRSDDGLALRGGVGDTRTIPAQKTLVTVGRAPRSDEAGIPGLMLDRDGPFLRIDEQCRTSMRDVYAIGDITGEPMLAHRAIAQGMMVADILAGHRRRWDARVVPAVCFTDPEIVTAGLLPDEAGATPVEVTRIPFTGNGRAMTIGDTEGFVRLVSRRDDAVLVGVQAVGKGVSELSSAFVTALEMGACLTDVERMVVAHPTLGEAFHEAVLTATGLPLHA